jgi:hypothetical protein
VPAPVEGGEVATGPKQRRLSPRNGVADRPSNRLRRGRSVRFPSPAPFSQPRLTLRGLLSLHLGEKQLLVACLLQVGQQGRSPGAAGVAAGLAPAQPAVVLLQRHDATAARASVLARMQVPEAAAGQTTAAGQHTPGETVGAADRQRASAPRSSRRGHAGGRDRPSRRWGTTVGPPTATACFPWSATGLVTFPGSAMSRSATVQPSVTQMMSRSSSLMLAG